MTWFGVACELHRDWRNDIDGLASLFSNHLPSYRCLITSYAAGEPIPEPVFGHGPFVMKGRAEIQQAFENYQLGENGCARVMRIHQAPGN